MVAELLYDFGGRYHCITLCYVRNSDILMKIGITGDWHLTDKTPRCRVDDYPETQKKKLEWIFNKCIEEGVRLLLQPGDFFDSSKLKDKVKTYWIDNLPNSIQIYTVPGQHDMRYHTSDIDDTPMGVLYAADSIEVINEVPKYLAHWGEPNTWIYGSGWNDPIPELADTSGPACHIWVTHRMVIKEKLWEAQTHYEKGDVLLKRTKFDLIVSGDNHQAFQYEYEGRKLVNCGSLMRSTIDQVTHEPQMAIYDTETKELEVIKIPIEPAEKVMQVEVARKEKERNEKMIEFIENFAESQGDIKFDFRRNLTDFIKANDVPADVRTIIDEVME